MPNWVDNTINVTGPAEKIKEFEDHITKQPKYAQDGDYFGFSFHSFVTLPPDTDKEVYLGTHGVVDGQQVGNEDINWYKWNLSHWDTKWDACDVDISRGLTSVHISFRTAWSPPEPVFKAMSTMFPDLTFTVWYEEEQGWGAEFTLKDGDTASGRSWDIPDSHADYTQQDKDCVCSWDEDTENWYDDCPGKVIRVYTVEIVTRMFVQALTEEGAIEAAKAEESGYDMPHEAVLKKVLYSDEYRVVNVEEQEEN